MPRRRGNKKETRRFLSAVGYVPPLSFFLIVTWIMKRNFNPKLTLPLSLPPFSLTSHGKFKGQHGVLCESERGFPMASAPSATPTLSQTPRARWESHPVPTNS